VPLRPVSELGLVDLTDLASREDQARAAARPPARASQNRQPWAARAPRDRQRPPAARAPEDRQRSTAVRAPEDRQRPSAARAPEDRQRPPAARAPEDRQRPPAARAPKDRQRPPDLRDTSEPAAHRRSRATAPTRSKRDSARRQSGARTPRRPDKTNRSVAATLGVSVLTAAVGLAGGLLFSRSTAGR
jgi:hypothetical protein